MAENWYKQILITAAEPSARSMSFNNGMKWIWPLYLKKNSLIFIAVVIMVKIASSMNILTWYIFFLLLIYKKYKYTKLWQRPPRTTLLRALHTVHFEPFIQVV